MSAYVISKLEVLDPVGIETYRTLAAKSIAQYGGRYLVRGGIADIAEGGPPLPTLRVLLEGCRLPPLQHDLAARLAGFQ
jgi:uncharacterized protein (DUF1330 family)